MKKIVSWVNIKWGDPVWSKVFASIILAILGYVGLILWALISKIPLTKLVRFLGDSKLEISFLSLFIIAILTIATLGPMIYFNIISFHLKAQKIPDNFEYRKIKIEEFLNGPWICEYSKASTNEYGVESLIIVNGTQYFIKGKLYFILTDFKYNQKKNEIIWTKTQHPQGTKHSTEKLIIKNDSELYGTDDAGFMIKYSKKKF